MRISLNFQDLQKLSDPQMKRALNKLVNEKAESLGQKKKKKKKRWFLWQNVG